MTVLTLTSTTASATTSSSPSPSRTEPPDPVGGPGPAAVRPAPRHRGRRAAGRDDGGGSGGSTGGTPAPRTAPGRRRWPTSPWCCYNADGSRAEMSGNGIRCLAQAWARRQRPDGAATLRLPPTPVCAASSSVRGPDRRHDRGRGRHGRRCRDRRAAPAGTDVGSRPAPARRATSASATRTPSWPSTTSDAVDLLLIGAAGAGREPGDRRARARARRHHHAGARARRRHHRGLRHRRRAQRHGPRRGGGLVAADGEITVHMDGGDAKVRLDQPRPGRVTLIGPATYVGTVHGRAGERGASGGCRAVTPTTRRSAPRSSSGRSGSRSCSSA